MTAENPDFQTRLEKASATARAKLIERNTTDFVRRLAIHDVLTSLATGQGLYAELSTLLLAHADEVSQLRLEVKKTPKGQEHYRHFLTLLPNSNDGNIHMRFTPYYYESKYFSPYYPVTYRPPTQGLSRMLGNRTFGNVFPDLHPGWLGQTNTILVRDEPSLLLPPQYEFIGEDSRFAEIDLPYFQDQLLAAIEDPTQWIPPAPKTTL